MECRYCGRKLETMLVPGLRREVALPCDCTEAVRAREEADRREWREERAKVLRRAIARAKIPPQLRLYPEWGDGTGVYLYGKQGRGKTERACGILRKFLNDGIIEEAHNRFFETRSAKYVCVPDWMMEMQATFGRRGVTEEDVMESYAGVGMLLLDDLGKGQMTPWRVERIYMVLDRRSRAGLPTVITTQYDIGSLTDMIHRATDEEMASAIRSRIEGMCRPHKVTGPDWRTAKRA